MATSVEKGHDAAHLEKMDSNDIDVKGSHDSTVQGENKLTFGFFMTMVGMALVFVVAEVTPLFLVTCFTIIAADLDALDRVIWILVAPYIATGAIAPFVGNLSDLMGRRAIILASCVLIVLGYVLSGAAPNFSCFLAGATITGAAIGIQILTVIAAASELVPMHKRGATIGYLAMAIIPFAPGPLYGQLIAEHSWRYIYLFLALVAVLGAIVLAIWYHPPPRPSALGLSKMEMLKRIDYGGCVLSILGVVLFLIGINWGGGEYAWGSARVVTFLILGIVVLMIFLAYEKWVTKYPMFPAALVQSKRHFFAVSVLCLVSGVNYVPLTVFWTIQTYTVYQASFSQAGVWLLPLGFCIVGGAMVSAIMISVFRKHIMWVLLLFCAMQTAGIGAMAAFDKDNINTVWAPMAIGLFGVGGVLLPSQVVFSVISPDDLIGTSVALSVVIRMIGQVVGKSMFYNVFRTSVTDLATSDLSLIAVPALSNGFTSIERIRVLVTQLTAGPLQFYVDRGLFPEITSTQAVEVLSAGGKELYSKCLPLLYYISIPWGAAAVIACFLLYGVDKYIDEHVAVHL